MATATQKLALDVLEEEEISLRKAAYRSILELARPSAIHKPQLTLDGDQWCALYGEDLQVGVAGFGNTPNHAMRNFDIQWLNALPAKQK